MLYFGCQETLVMGGFALNSFFYERIVQYHETDQMKIVHHSNYIKWFEEARSALLSDLGIGYDKMEDLGVTSPVVSINCEYLSPTKYGETITVEVIVKEFNGVRAVFSYVVRDKLRDEIKAAGESKHCFLNSKNKVISLKKEQHNIYSALNEYKNASI